MTDYEFMLEDRIAKIRAINEQYDLENNAYISFSGGKDSTILHYLIDMALPNNKIPRVYINTGIEYKLVRLFVKGLAETDDRIKIVNSNVNIKQMLNTYGYPFKSKQHSHNWSIYNNNNIELDKIIKYLTENPSERFNYDYIHNLPKGIKLIISFADEAQGHCGIIYQATNWYYLGQNGGGKMLLTESGVKKHTRLLGIYRMRHPEYKEYTNEELMEKLGYTYTESGRKHRYVYLRGTKREKKEMYELIKDKIQPYPKIDKKPSISEMEILEEESKAAPSEAKQISLFDMEEEKP